MRTDPKMLSDSADRPTLSEGEAPADDITITPEMIEAGLAELASFNEDFESREDFVRRLYAAMASAS